MADPATNLPPGLDEEALNRWFDQRFKEKMHELEAQKTPSLAMIASRGSLDWAYPPFILASTAAAMDWDVKIFFTFYGLQLLQKDLNLSVTALGNPGMPMKMPFGPSWFQGINWKIPNVVMGLPGFEALTTTLMKKTTRNKNVAPVAELREAAILGGAEFYACQMTVDLFGYKKETFLEEGIQDWVGAASFLSMAVNSDITLFI